MSHTNNKEEDEACGAAASPPLAAPRPGPAPAAAAPPLPYGRLLLVDLAGSERNYETVKMTPAMHRESAQINTALMALKDCFRALHNHVNKSYGIATAELKAKNRALSGFDGKWGSETASTGAARPLRSAATHAFECS